MILSNDSVTGGWRRSTVYRVELRGMRGPGNAKTQEGGHYPRTIITKRGVIRLMVPRGVGRKYSYSLFKRFKRKTEGFEHIVAEALLRGHSSRKASAFFKEMFGENTISHQAALQTLRKFDYEVKDWKKKRLRNNAVILVLDAVWLRGVIPCLKGAKPVLFAYAVYADGTKEVLDFELVRGESSNAWCRFCQRLEMRGLRDVRLVVRDDTDAIAGAVALVWPGAQDQLCIFHVLKNLNKKLEGLENRKLILKHASELYDAQSEEEFYKRAEGFKNTWIGYREHPAFRYFFNKLVDTLRYYELPREYWRAARTTNRLP
jgi:transposase-like protein